MHGNWSWTCWMFHSMWSLQIRSMLFRFRPTFIWGQVKLICDFRKHGLPVFRVNPSHFIGLAEKTENPALFQHKINVFSFPSYVIPCKNIWLFLYPTFQIWKAFYVKSKSRQQVANHLQTILLVFQLVQSASNAYLLKSLNEYPHFKQHLTRLYKKYKKFV